jgi:Uma2 family endonuclease
MAVSRPDLAAATEAELVDLERLWHDLDLPGHRIELIDGQIVVSPSASWSHSTVVDGLMDQLFDVKRRHSWHFHVHLTVHIPATRERLIPDLMIAPKDAPRFDDNELLAPGALLVAEVVSPSTRRQDRVAKPRAYAQGGVPLYLVVDQFTDPPAVILSSQPGEQGYARTEIAEAGQPLKLPEPFGLPLDTARLLS